MPAPRVAHPRAQRFLGRTAVEALRGAAGAHRDDPRRGGDRAIPAERGPRSRPCGPGASRATAAAADGAEPRGPHGARHPARRDGDRAPAAAGRAAADRRRGIPPDQSRGAGARAGARGARDVPGIHSRRDAAELLPRGRRIRPADARARGLRAGHRGGARLRHAGARHAGGRDARSAERPGRLPGLSWDQRRDHGRGPAAVPRDHGARPRRVRAAAVRVPRARRATLHVGARHHGARGRARSRRGARSRSRGNATARRAPAAQRLRGASRVPRLRRVDASQRAALSGRAASPV